MTNYLIVETFSRAVSRIQEHRTCHHVPSIFVHVALVCLFRFGNVYTCMLLVDKRKDNLYTYLQFRHSLISILSAKCGDVIGNRDRIDIVTYTELRIAYMYKINRSCIE